jgi:hypothetical protein
MDVPPQWVSALNSYEYCTGIGVDAVVGGDAVVVLALVAVTVNAAVVVLKAMMREPPG